MKTFSVSWRAVLMLSTIALMAAFIFGGTNAPKVKEVSAGEAMALIESGAVVIDVREPSVSIASHIPGAHLYPIQVLGSKLTELEVYKGKPIVVYCNEGTSRGPRATEMLNKAGHAQAVNLKSGIEGWRAANLPLSGRQ